MPSRKFQLDYYDQKWHDTGDAHVHDQMGEAKWQLVDSNAASNAVLQKAGDQFGADALKWFQGRGNPDTKYQGGPINGRVESLNAVKEGVRVTLRLQREADIPDPWGRPSHENLSMEVKFTLKYEGLVNGQHRFKVVGFEYDDVSAKHGAPPLGDQILAAFGTNVNEVNAQFTQVRV